MKRYLVKYKITKDSKEQLFKAYSTDSTSAELLAFDKCDRYTLYYVDAVLLKCK